MSDKKARIGAFDKVAPNMIEFELVSVWNGETIKETVVIEVDKGGLDIKVRLAEHSAVEAYAVYDLED